MPLRTWVPKSLLDEVEDLDFMDDARTMVDTFKRDATATLTQASQRAAQAVAPVAAAVPTFTLPSMEELTAGWGDDEPGLHQSERRPCRCRRRRPERRRAGGSTLPSMEELTANWEREPEPEQTAAPTTREEATGLDGRTGTAMPDGGPRPTPASRGGRRWGRSTRRIGRRPDRPPRPRFRRSRSGPAGKFFRTAGPYAALVERETGVPAALSLAIAANETGYGQRRFMAGDFNYHGIQDTTGTGTPYIDWRPGPNGEKISYEARQAGFASPLEGFRGFAKFLLENKRYAPALERYRQSGDVYRLVADVHAAGYAEDPAYTGKIQSMIASIPAEAMTAPTGKPRPPPSDSPSRRRSRAATRVGFEGITPEQFGLGDADAESIYGPGSDDGLRAGEQAEPDYRRGEAARRVARRLDAPGHGRAASDRRGAERDGRPAVFEEGPLNIEKIRHDVQNGNPVGINTPGHYFVVEGVDEQGRLNLSASARALRASGGRAWFRPEEIASLGMGAPTGRATRTARQPDPERGGAGDRHADRLARRRLRRLQPSRGGCPGGDRRAAARPVYEGEQGAVSAPTTVAPGVYPGEQERFPRRSSSQPAGRQSPQDVGGRGRADAASRPAPPIDDNRSYVPEQEGGSVAGVADPCAPDGRRGGTELLKPNASRRSGIGTTGRAIATSVIKFPGGEYSDPFAAGLSGRGKAGPSVPGSAERSPGDIVIDAALNIRPPGRRHP